MAGEKLMRVFKTKSISAFCFGFFLAVHNGEYEAGNYL